MAECTVCHLPSAGWGWLMVLIDESMRDGLLCSNDSYCYTIRVFGCLRFWQRDAWALLQDNRWPHPNLGCDTNVRQLYSDSRPAAALFLEQKVCEISIRPHTAVSLHQIKEHYTNWMGARTHDCSDWIQMHQFNSLIFSLYWSCVPQIKR